MDKTSGLISLAEWWERLPFAWQHALADNFDWVTPPTGRDLVQYLGVTELDLSGSAIQDLEPLLMFPCLEKLDLSHTKVSNLTPLYMLSNLQELHFTCNRELDLMTLSKLLQLKVLDISYPLAKASGSLDVLENLPHLQELYCNACDLSSVIPFMGMGQLKTLSLSFNPIPPAELHAMQEIFRDCQILF